MLCNDCKIGGELNARGIALREAGNANKAAETFDAADACHEKCRGCTCQHTTGMDKVLRRG